MGTQTKREIGHGTQPDTLLEKRQTENMLVPFNEREQLEIWELERQILKQVARERALHIILLRWKRTVFESVVPHWKEVA